MRRDEAVLSFAISWAEKAQIRHSGSRLLSSCLLVTIGCLKGMVYLNCILLLIEICVYQVGEVREWGFSKSSGSGLGGNKGQLFTSGIDNTFVFFVKQLGNFGFFCALMANFRHKAFLLSLRVSFQNIIRLHYMLYVPPP